MGDIFRFESTSLKTCYLKLLNTDQNIGQLEYSNPLCLFFIVYDVYVPVVLALNIQQ